MIRERIIRMYIDDAALSFDSDEAIQRFQHALGRMASYSLRAQNNHGLEHVDISIAATKEITGAFYPAVSWKPEGPPSEHEPFLALSQSIDAFRGGAPYVIAAVLNEHGEYEYNL